MKITVILLFISLSASAAQQFIAIGDSGKDNDGQKIVAEAIHNHCAQSVCHAGILLGDNIYPAGMTSPQDPVLDRVFKKYYDKLNFPFYVALGNHDYGKYSNDWEKGSFEIEYGKRNPQFVLPNFYYYQEFEDMVLVVLDTTRLMWNKDFAAQEKMLNLAYAKAGGKWFVVVGHHPYLSNGNHGNAGDYERVPFPPMVSGRDVKKFIDKNVCGKAHLFLSGHDHNLQLIDGKIAGCSTLFALSGAAASTEPLTPRNEAEFTAELLGFLSITVYVNQIDLHFIGENNKSLYRYTLRK